MFINLIKDIIAFGMIFGIFAMVSHVGGTSQNLLMSNGTRSIKWLAPSTIVHELSHLIVALITFNRVVKVVLFHYDPETGNLGHVDIAYAEEDSHKISKQISLLFFGLAPIFIIGLILVLSFHGLFPNVSAKVAHDVMNVDDMNVFQLFFKVIGDVLFNVPSGSGILHAIVFIIELVILSPGFALSDQDFNVGKGAWTPLIVGGLIITLIIQGMLPALSNNLSVAFSSFMLVGIIVLATQSVANLILIIFEK